MRLLALRAILGLSSVFYISVAGLPTSVGTAFKITDVPSNLTTVPSNSSNGPISPTVETWQLSADPTFQFQLLLINGLATYHGSSTNDVLKAALYIEPDETFLQSGAVNARETYFAAASYYRAADFYLHGNWSDPRINVFWDLQTECYNKAIASLPTPGQRMTIPAQGFDIPVIFYAADQSSANVKRKTIIMGNGYDAAQEELMHFFIFPALSRGWNVITYEGPGQPTALLLDGGIYDAHASFAGQLNIDPMLKGLFDAGQQSEFDNTVAELLRSPQTPSGLRWGIEQGLWAFNINGPYEFLQATKAYSIADVFGQIRMPTWIAAAANDQFFQGQPELVKQALGSRATLHRFDGPAGYHNQVGAAEEANRVMHIWLDKVFRP
ncbi:hypothetical protein LTR38_014983 [Friedmanniomyces endolithicus]|nr:hypothetical protein LTR38_014983 [Friedmanniomyces endolithicus]